MQKFIYCLFFFNIFFCANAQNDTSHTLSPVEIKSKFKRSAATTSTPVQILSAKDLSNINAQSVADAAKYFSGVQVKDYGGIGGLKTISVRSLGTNHTGVSYNGIMLNDAQNGQIDLGKFSLDNVGEIRLYNAQPTNILQPARAFSSASVLEIKTIEPEFDDKKIKLNTSFKTGSFGLINPAANISYQWNDKLYSTLNTEWQRSAGNYPFHYQDADTVVHAIRKNSDVNNYRIQQQTKYYFDSSSSLDFVVYYYNSRRGLPTAIDPKNTFTSDRLWNKNFFAQILWKKIFKQQNGLLIGTKYNNDYTHYLDPDYLGAMGKLENSFRQNEWYFTASYKYFVTPKFNLAVASDYFRNTLTANFFYDNANFPNPVRCTWLNNIAATYTSKKLHVSANILSTNIFNKVHFGSKPPDYQKYTPAFSIDYLLSKTIPLKLRFFYKNIFRVPTFNDLYYTQVGNTNLKPEFAKQYNLGITWQKNYSGKFIESCELTADAYYNHVTDKIVAVPRQNLFQWTMLNYGKVSITGLEVTGKVSTSVKQYHITLWGNYTYQKSLDITDKSSASYRSQIPYTPVNSGSLGLWINSKNITISYNALLSGYRYTLGQNSYVTYLPAWNEHDVKVAYTFDKQKCGAWTLSVELNNIFNQQYQIVKYYPMPGRSFFIMLRHAI